MARSGIKAKPWRVLRSLAPASSAMLFGNQADGEGMASSYNLWLRDVFEEICLQGGSVFNA
jgi:hypothetical protein